MKTIVPPATKRNPHSAKLLRWISGASILCCMGVMPSAIAASPAARLDAQLALSDPDKFNWLILIQISAKAPSDLQFKLPGGGETNNAVWETWASDNFTFGWQGPLQFAPPDPKVPPKWDDRNKLLSKFEPVFPGMKRLPGSAVSIKRADGFTEAMLSNPIIERDETRRNQATFEFIVNNQLYYKQGLAAAFSSAIDKDGYPNGKSMTFPSDAIEIKAVWAPITSTSALQKGNCHWNYDENGVLYGLVALHIITRTLPNWTWATWEWYGNPGRSDWTGSQDSFGVSYGDTRNFQPPMVDSSGHPTEGAIYSPGVPTARLIQAFRDAGFTEEWLGEWWNYRLKGSQIDFTDASGKPVILGNSIIERGFAQTSSCMTCHALAGINSGGHPRESFFSSDRQSFNGAPNPAMLNDMNSFRATKEHRYKPIYYGTSFVWAIPSRATAADVPETKK